MIGVEARTSTAPEFATETETRLVGLWHVIVINDPVNLMSYVVMVLRKIFGFDDTKARKHMLEVHENGRSIVWSGERERAEAYANTLHQWQKSLRW